MEGMQEGSTISDRYVLERQIGEGGMATVWRARDRTLRRPVAIKFLWARERQGHKERVKAFLREARIAASVHHANVVQVLDFGLHGEDVPYMVMEVLEGETLGDQFNAGEVYSMEQVVHIAAGTLEGIIAVHDAGIVHRDLKPENIFLVPQRNRMQPKLLDFGISRAVDRKSGLRSAVTTQEGRVIGTPEYMSPEQARGIADVDGRTDIYAMGVILYEMIVGDVPYKAPHFGDLIIMIVKGGAPEVIDIVPSVGQQVSDFIAKAMAVDPDDRFDDAAQMYDTLLEVAQPFGGTDALVLSMPGRQERHRGTQSGPGETTGDDLEVSLGRSSMMGFMESGAPSALPPDDEQDAQPQGGAASPAPASAISPSDAGAAPAGGAPWVPILAVLVALGVGAAIMARLQESAPAQQPSFIVVQGTQEGAAVTAEVAAPSTPGNPEQTADDGASAAGAQAAPPTPAEQKPRPRPKAPKSPKVSRTELLANAFKRQKSNVVKCFRTHGESGEASISVRVQVSVSGAVEGAQVLPPPAADTPAGKCVEQAVRRMRFGPQPSSASFRVPLYVTRGG